MKLHEAAAYLPYGLKFKWKSDLYPTPTMNGLHRNQMYLNYHGYHLSCTIGDVKPILRPLSDLTKEITENGKTFVPIDSVLDMCMRGGKHEMDFLYSVSTGSLFIESIPMWAMQKLLSWHFDIFNLIKSGEAIDVNTLEKNPYE